MVKTTDSVTISSDSAPPRWFVSGDTVDLEIACIHEQFEAQVRRDPDAIAVEVDGNTLTYQELNQRANRLAHHLRGRGVGPDVLVGISMEQSFDLVIAIYGILKAGGAYVPLDPTYPLDRLHYMVAAAKLQFLVTHSTCVHLFGGLSGLDTVLVDESRATIECESESNLGPLAAEHNLIYVIFTSGSTGKPKAAAVYHRGFSNLVQWFVFEFEITNQDHALLVSSLSFDLTQKNLFATLISGGTLHLYPPGPYDVSVLSQLIHEREITLVNCTPSAFYPLVDPFDEESAPSLASLRIVFLGGEPISIARIKPWMSHSTCNAEIANTYGPTECTDICGFYRLTLDNLEKYDFVPLGRPIRNVQMVILDTEMESCPIGQYGELCVGGAGVGAGYINDPEMTCEKFVANERPEVTSQLLYRTGDQARWHEDGVIEFLGRLDHQVKIRGFRIELPEIERAMELHPCVSEAIVIVKTDSSGGDSRLVCCFTTNKANEARTVSVAELRCYLAERLPAHMIPSTFDEFPAFPLSPNGKVDRNALKDIVGAQNSDATPAPSRPVFGARPVIGASPVGGVEDRIRAAWCQVLDCAETGLDENFFDIGGDSIRLARLHQLLEKMLDRKFPLTDLFAHTTVRAMSRHLSRRPNESGNQQARDRARMQRAVRSAQRRNRA